MSPHPHRVTRTSKLKHRGGGTPAILDETRGYLQSPHLSIGVLQGTKSIDGRKHDPVMRLKTAVWLLEVLPNRSHILKSLDCRKHFSVYFSIVCRE